MENEPELIRDQMQDTRTAMTEKIEAVEQLVSSTVQSATAKVEETVQSVKDAVTDTVGAVKDTVDSTVSTVKDTVRDTFDLPGHLQRHPWMSLAGAVAVGYIGGRLLHGAGVGRRRTNYGTPSGVSSFPEPMARQASSSPEPRRSNGRGVERMKESGPSWLGGMVDTYRDEIDKLKGLGLSMLVGLVRDMVTRSVPPEIGGRVRDWMDGVTQKMGGQPLHEPILSESADEPVSQVDVASRSSMPARGKGAVAPM